MCGAAQVWALWAVHKGEAILDMQPQLTVPCRARTGVDTLSALLQPKLYMGFVEGKDRPTVVASCTCCKVEAWVEPLFADVVRMAW